MNTVARRIAAAPSSRVGKWIVLGIWIVALVGLGSLAGKLSGAEDNQTSSWLPGSAESTQVVNLQGNFYPSTDATTIVVYTRAGGVTAADKAKAGNDAAAFRSVAHVRSQIVGPVPSKDGAALETILRVDLSTNGWNNLKPAVDQIRTIATAGDSGLTVHITGPGGYGADQAKAFSGIDGTLLYGTISVVVILLLLTYRSPILWLLPLMSAGLALAVAEGVIYLLASHAGLTVNAQSAGILLVLVMGAGTDYALLLIARYREELRNYEDRHEAMAHALHRAGPAIFASASTVAIGMLCLLAAQMNSTRGLGPVCAIGVVVALAAMTTLLPALLTIFGRWIFWPVRPTHGSPEPTATGPWSRVGRGIGRRPRTTWLVTALILGACAIGLTGLKADGLSNAGSFTNTPDSVIGQQVLDQHYPAGSGSPIIVIANAAEANQVDQALGSTPGIVATAPPIVKNDLVYLQGTLGMAPDSQAAMNTVDAVRASVHAVPGADAKVGGNTAVTLDIKRAAQHDNKVIIPLVLLVVLVILGVLLRAVVAPLVLILTVVLSFAASLGISTQVFEHLFHFTGEDSAFPLFVFVFLVALGIDYNIFLMTRVREETITSNTRRGALIGLSTTGGVITSAGLILAGTFAVLGTLPVVAFAEIGFAVALGVLLDTLVVRSVLVTALTMDIGRRIWWPSRLARADAEVPESTEAQLVR